MGGMGAPDKLIVKGKRLDGRKLDEMRPIKIEAGVIQNAAGSASVSMGSTSAVAAIYGPREALPRHIAKPDRAVIRCIYTMIAFSTPDRVRPGPSRRSHEISKVIQDALASIILLEKYPNTKIDIYIEITNASAGTRCAALTAAAVALADAGIEMRDLISSIAIGKIDGQLALDLFDVEDNFGEADLPIAIAARTGEISLLQMDGALTEDEIKKALEMASKACKEINKEQIKALKNKYKKEAAE